MLLVLFDAVATLNPTTFFDKTDRTRGALEEAGMAVANSLVSL
jgi:hypothetical protein